MAMFSAGVHDVLGLRGRAGGGACALDPLVAQLLKLIRDTAPADAAQAHTGTRQQLETLGQALLARTDKATAVELTPSILALCAALLDRLPRHSDVGREIAAAVTLVREALLTLSGDEQALQRSLADTAGRFDSLHTVKDLHELKECLAREVHSLKEVASTRARQWQEQVAMVQEKVKALEHQLEESRVGATFDALTGLVNRKSVEASFATLKAARLPFVLALFDIDHFKTVNDTQGHLVGDAVLQMVARALQDSVRRHDVVGRFGGDEFVLVMPHLSLAQGEGRLRAILAAVRASSAGRQPPLPPVTATCGATEFAAGDTFESVLERADKALYDAKRSGRDRLRVSEAPYLRDLKQR